MMSVLEDVFKETHACKKDSSADNFDIIVNIDKEGDFLKFGWLGCCSATKTY